MHIDISIVSSIKSPYSICLTRGIGDGLIVKFYDMYIKIYHDKPDEYTITGYRYGNDVPLFVDDVPDTKIREYLSHY